MKKVLALVLAVVLAFGMTTIAIAADAKGKANNIHVDTKLLTYKDDKMVDGELNKDGTLKANATYYMLVNDADGNIDSLSDLDNYKIRTVIDEGASYIASKPAFVIKKDGDVKKAYITFKTADKFQMEGVAFEMSVNVYGKENYVIDSGKLDATVATVAKDIAYETDNAATYSVIKGQIVSFDDCEDVEMVFEDDVVFAVNASGQKDLFLRLDTEDTALEDKNPEANLSVYYFAGNNKTFRRTGTLTIPAEMIENKDGKMVAPYIYSNENGKLVALKDAKYDEDAAAFTIKTNKLGKYVVSDIELKSVDTTTPGTGSETEKPSTGSEKNPDTGANDFVGLAVALAVVSVAGIAVAKRK
ncbi:hypothetical protein EDD70_0345 [Hydrogenoanaerobacterium saccharovorans]|uniref:Gram-positive cocci surface proteins LPxTG domain-containing protein n=1 Tax=Hydrogenoanaerobacterium saccharovorans TaxID=474960 RepID=A0A1H8B7A0_9FIRM|nr:hypothetical protein [Hydrogenoanaerobacterium saccharovorans]RPF47555.1 hypothetical protein EDD70_0345 [Hydrogenoanaerobacterium saccharovorans]SEM78633.1 hypothetical protein SAMN05216180_1748 [Hydrogenoanaerobacterium saccharovorans]